MLTTALLLMTATGHVLGLPTIHSRDIELKTHIGENEIQWSSDCSYLGLESELPYSCANFKVPLDYDDPKSEETLSLTLTRIDAVKQPAKGSVLFNPGGPGAGGADFTLEFGNEFMTILAGEFNLIGFDPRGTADTLRFDCYDNSDTERLLLSPPDGTLGNASDTALGQNLASSKVTAAQCLNATADIGGLIGTAFVARDMARIADALGEDGLLRYWGFSYGTALGATFSAMFPEKVDKVVIDGNVNVQQYYSGWETESLVDLDGVVQGFYDGCVASSENCALAQVGQDSGDIANVVEKFLETLRFSPIAVTTDEGSTIVTYTSVKKLMFENMYAPHTWPALATLLDSLVKGNATGYVELLSQLSGGSNKTSREAPDAFYGIRCGDVGFRADTMSAFDPFKAAVVPTSKWGGLDVGLENIMDCGPWQMRAKEVYSGPWEIQTKNPLLIIGNTHDPVTPLVSARNNSAVFGGSVLLQHNGYGHCSIAQPSLCTAKLVQAYFKNGTLPAAGTICEADVPLFSNQTWLEAFSPISLNGTTTRMTKRSVEDTALLGAMTKLSRDFPHYGRTG